MDSSENQDLINRLNLLLEMNSTISSTKNFDELLSKITNTTSIVMKSEASSIALLDHSSDELVFQFVHGSVGESIRTIRVPVGTGISGWVAKYGLPLVIPDAKDNPKIAVLKSVDGHKTINDLLWNSSFDRYSFFNAIKELDEDQMIRF